MSAKRKTTTAKSDAEETVFGSFIFADGMTAPTDVEIPTGTGPTLEELEHEALQYVQALRRVSGSRKNDSTPEGAEGDIQTLAAIAAHAVTTRFLHVFRERFGDEAERALGSDYDVQVAIEQHRERIAQALRESDTAQLMSNMRKEAAEKALHDLEEVEGPALYELDEVTFSERYMAIFRKRGRDHTRGLIATYAGLVAYELLDKLNLETLAFDEFLARLRFSSPEAARLMSSSHDLRLLADRAGEKLVRYVGGKEQPIGRTEDGFDKLAPVKRYAWELHFLHVRSSPEYFASVFDPKSVKPVIEEIHAERNETKAKTLLATFAYAATAKDVGAFIVDLEDLVELVSGYKRTGPAKTNRRYYLRKVAVILRYLHIDLASLQVNIRVVRTKRNGARVDGVLNEYLMHRPRLESLQGIAYEEFYDEIHNLIISSAALEDAQTTDERQHAEQARDRAIHYLEAIKPTGVRLGFPDDVAAALALKSNEASELVNPEVLKALSGAAFWLAYDVAFRRRWTRGQALKKGTGIPLLEALKENGFIDESRKRTGDRPSYKQALRSFFAAIATLLNLGELDEPGIQILQPHAGPGRPRNITADVKAWVEKRGKHITEHDLRPLTVKYVLVEERVKELDASRRSRQPRRISQKRRAG